MNKPLRLLGSAARAFIPVGGPVLARHLANFAVLETRFPALDWPREGERVWILSPHPDDETLGCGGLLARCAERGLAAKVVFLTCGDGTRTTQIAHTLNPSFSAPHDLFSIANERQIEAIGAAKALGLNENDIEFLGYPDGGIEAIWTGDYSQANPFVSSTTAKMRVPYERARTPGAAYYKESLLNDLVASLEEFRPTLVLTTPGFDKHRDHIASFWALEAALQKAKLKKVPDFWVFLIHLGIWPVPNGLHPQKRLVPPAHLLQAHDWHALELTPKEIETKRQALQSHKTQLASTPRYLHAFVRQNELFAPVKPKPAPKQ